MKYSVKKIVVALFVCFLSISATFAQKEGRDMAKEQIIWNELKRKSPGAVEIFKQATEKMDQDKHREAIALYSKVLEKVPNFDHALRRIAYPQTAIGDRGGALKNIRKAVGLKRSPENLFGYASVKVNLGHKNYNPTRADFREATFLAKEAYMKDPEKDVDYALMVVQFALEADDVAEFDKGLAALKLHHPNEGGTHYFEAINQANKGNFDEAIAATKKAESLGVSKDITRSMLAALEKAKGESFYGWEKYLYYIFAFVGLWVFGLIALFVAGKVLSAKTLSSIESSPANDITGVAQNDIKSIYRKLITVAGVYYFISQPIIIFLVIALTGAIILLFLSMGVIPIKLLGILVVIALATIGYMIKSLVIKAKVEDPGRVLRKAEAPELWKLVYDVAKTLKTRPVDEIRITHGTELAVYERGSIREKMRDKADRILIIGLAVVNGFEKNAFRAVLAHEYGHFSNRDTAGGDIAFHVNSKIMQAAQEMAESGTATFYNIAFQFLRFYHFLFRRITHGASRLQEILADRVAVYQFGGEAFREGLKHVIRREIEFGHLADREINAAFAANRAIQNLYNLKVEDDLTRRDIDNTFKKCLTEATTEDDSHPSPKDRFRLSEKVRSKKFVPLEGQVWDLFKNREALTIEINKMLEENLRLYAEAEAAAAAESAA